MKIRDLCEAVGIPTAYYYRYARRLGHRPTFKQLMSMAKATKTRGRGRPRENLTQKYKY